MGFSTFFSALRNRNRPRIFLAYESRSHKPGDEPYHVALLVRPHPLDLESVSTLRLHAMNKVQPGTAENPVAHQVWVFDTKDTKFLTDRLAGLLYLGQLPRGKSLDDVTKACASVPVDPPGEEVWRCTHWMRDAIQRLVEEGIIDPLPCSSKELHAKGRDYIYEAKKQNPRDIITVDVQITPCDFSV